jgi:Flp pilus assembly protein TadD
MRRQFVRVRLARAGAVGLLCVFQAACNTVDFGAASLTAGESAASPEARRLMQLAGDVEARGEYETAAALYARAAETSGDGAEAQLRLGNAYLKAGNYPAARAAFVKVLATDSGNAEALFGFGTVQLKNGEIDDSVRTLTTASPLVNTSSAYSRLGTALIMAGRSDEALEAFARAQSLAPNDLDVTANMAFAQVLLGRNDEAVAAMQKVVQSPLAQTRHRANLLLMLAIAGRVDEARAMNVPGLSPGQKRDLLLRARKVRDAKSAPAKARAIGLLQAA